MAKPLLGEDFPPADAQPLSREVSELTKLVAQVASSYLGAQRVNGPDEIAAVVAAVADSLRKVDSSGSSGVGAPQEATAGPASKMSKAQWGKLVKDEAIISLLDNKGYKTMRRHLATNGMTPESYIERFGLPADFPMVAPAYSRARSEMAKSLGLGQRVTRNRATAPTAPLTMANAPKTRAARAKKPKTTPAE